MQVDRCTPSSTKDSQTRAPNEAPLDGAKSSNTSSQTSSGAVISSSGSDNDDAGAHSQQTAAPAGDVTWLFRRVLAMPPVQGLEALSLAELARGG